MTATRPDQIKALTALQELGGRATLEVIAEKAKLSEPLTRQALNMPSDDHRMCVRYLAAGNALPPMYALTEAGTELLARATAPSP